MCTYESEPFRCNLLTLFTYTVDYPNPQCSSRPLRHDLATVEPFPEVLSVFPGSTTTLTSFGTFLRLEPLHICLNDLL